NDGVWEGERVLPEGWVEESTAISAPPPAEAGYPFRYGYQWWTPPDADEEIFAIGVYGQWIWIDRKAKVVVVRTSANRNFRANNSQSRLDSIAMYRAIARP
ncbi:MAG: serine hydrolase, partial [Pseudomonadota bacterium]